MAAGNSGDIQMNGNVDWNAIAKQTLRYQYDAKRASVCLWFILFFFNAEQRREAANQWESLWHDLSFVEQMALPQPPPEMKPAPYPVEQMNADLALLFKNGDVKMLSETALLKPESLTFDEEGFRNRLLDRYTDNGISIEPGMERLADTLPAEFSFLQALISQRADDKEQARFFFGHLRPLGYATIKVLREKASGTNLELVAQALHRFLVAEETLYKNGYEGEPLSSDQLKTKNRVARRGEIFISPLFSALGS